MRHVLLIVMTLTLLNADAKQCRHYLDLASKNGTASSQFITAGRVDDAKKYARKFQSNLIFARIECKDIDQRAVESTNNVLDHFNRLEAAMVEAKVLSSSSI